MAYVSPQPARARDEVAFAREVLWATQQSILEQQQRDETEQFEQAMATARAESEQLAMLREHDQQQLQQKLDEVGLREVPVPRDGNCQFHALVAGIEVNHVELRDELCDWLDANRHFRLKEDDEHTELMHYLDFDTDWDSFVQRMRREGQYGDHLTLIAAAEVTAARIIVITSQAQGVNYHVVPRGVTPARTAHLYPKLSPQVHYPLQMHFNLAQEKEEDPHSPPNLTNRDLTKSIELTQSIDLSQHLCASFVFVVDTPQQTQRRARTTFHPITGRLSVGSADLQTLVAAMDTSTVPQQVALSWLDEDGDWISFDSENELVTAVESVAARGHTRTIHLRAQVLDTALCSDQAPLVGIFVDTGHVVDQFEISELSTPPTSPTSAWVLVGEESVCE